MASGLTVIKIDSHVKEIDRVLDVRIKKALSLMGEIVEGYAKEDCPVDTGNLRNSLTHEGRENNAEYVGSNVEYAPYVEFGSYNHVVGKNHFLRDGAQNHVEELRKVAAQTISSEIY